MNDGLGADPIKFSPGIASGRSPPTVVEKNAVGCYRLHPPRPISVNQTESKK